MAYGINRVPRDVDPASEALATLQAAERMAAARRPVADPDPIVRADCGHRVPRSCLMRASLGTSCPDCYDRMSDGW
jgi:hypothetical protein